ncbi:Phage tail-collar fibre protein [Balnearium lithotrophicum]|uniref:Phage tail-collar fibre protein n=1 Tax=Balnearium lithotrophicum TaxID=223788 RepID=A0A521CHU5_9BACT|nr:phage tail protein [Balnearium lithotrophicum]SMO58998.1 Phage tail-collar fibre protein [Balnearium lithotrophicum]
MAEEIKLIPITTTAGLQKFFQASGLPEVKLKLTHIGFGDAGYTPDKDQTSLKNEIIRIPISSGKVFPSDGYMDLSALIPENAPEFWIREIGWYLEDGTLAFVWSHPEVPIAWKNKNLKLLAGISIRVTDVPLDKIEIVESNPDLKLLYTEEFMQIAQMLTNHEIAIISIKDKADEAIATANAVKEELQNVQVPRITILEERAEEIKQNLLLEELTDQTVLARIGNAITDISEKLRVVNTSKLNEVEEEIDKIEKLLAQVKEKVDSDVVAGFQSEIDDIKTQIENLKSSKADKSYVDSTFAKTSDLDGYATKDYVDNNYTSLDTANYILKSRKKITYSPKEGSSLDIGETVVFEASGQKELKANVSLTKGIYEVAIFIDDSYSDKPVIYLTDNNGNQHSFSPVDQLDDDSAISFKLFCCDEGISIQGGISYDESDTAKYNSNFASFSNHWKVNGSTVSNLTFKVEDSKGNPTSLTGKLTITKLV